jgi:hypothetical protein
MNFLQLRNYCHYPIYGHMSLRLSGTRAALIAPNEVVLGTQQLSAEEFGTPCIRGRISSHRVLNLGDVRF